METGALCKLGPKNLFKSYSSSFLRLFDEETETCNFGTWWAEIRDCEDIHKFSQLELQLFSSWYYQTDGRINKRVRAYMHRRDFAAISLASGSLKSFERIRFWIVGQVVWERTWVLMETSWWRIFYSSCAKNIFGHYRLLYFPLPVFLHLPSFSLLYYFIIRGVLFWNRSVVFDFSLLGLEILQLLHTTKEILSPKNKSCIMEMSLSVSMKPPLSMLKFSGDGPLRCSKRARIQNKTIRHNEPSWPAEVLR